MWTILIRNWWKDSRKNTFIAMVEGVREQALELGLMDAENWDSGMAEMYRAAAPGGTFC